MNARPRHPVLVMHDQFEALLERRDRADEMLFALMQHPRFWATGDGLHEINEIKIDIHKTMVTFVTTARALYPMAHLRWNDKEFNAYERIEETEQ